MSESVVLTVLAVFSMIQFDEVLLWDKTHKDKVKLCLQQFSENRMLRKISVFGTKNSIKVDAENSIMRTYIISVPTNINIAMTSVTMG